ncbi:SPW repeat protein [Rhizobiaceae bacterium n13]|uniref:SPW repeat protein n=1 Tax=Ferirhizobium litorale TaxID=2927786 RepID=A0AAE3U2G1_9HYPH|nr:SPW repeat protein [Fererhizobium litorale]MDI7863623.1 SPW repeat protein [Fererhizobium litorale]MDI7923456.1 SPW repeat protein [Fererhizobium litorale]
MKNEIPSKGFEWCNLLLGAGLACSASMFADLPAAAWNAGIVGALIVCCSAIALYRYGDWAEWSNLTLGCWAVVAPFLLGFGNAPTEMWTHVVVGLSVASIAIAQILASRNRSAPPSTK